MFSLKSSYTVYEVEYYYLKIDRDKQTTIFLYSAVQNDMKFLINRKT